MQPFDQRISIVILSTLDRLEMKEAGAFLARRLLALTTALHFLFWIGGAKKSIFLHPPRNGFGSGRDGPAKVSGVPVALSAGGGADGNWMDGEVSTLKGNLTLARSLRKCVGINEQHSSATVSHSKKIKNKKLLWNIMTPEFDQIPQLCVAKKTASCNSSQQRQLTFDDSCY